MQKQFGVVFFFFFRLLKSRHFHDRSFSTWQRGCVHIWYPNRHQHRHTHIHTHKSACFPDCIHQPESVSPPSCSQLSPLQTESRLMLHYQRWRCLAEKESPGEKGGGGEGREGWTVSFDWLAADGTPGVFIPRRQLISGACKSAWQVFTGAVNPADSIHFANCSDAASLRGEDQTFAPFSPR